MSTESNHPAITFAAQYGGNAQHYLTAYTSVVRMETLLSDLDSLIIMETEKRADLDHWLPWYGSEAYSYYAVGFTTCLEWHARSRLVDLLKYKPSSLRVEDVRGSISDKLIVQMVAQQASVAQLVSASLKIGSLDRYLSIMMRVFDALGVPCSPTDWLTGRMEGATACWIADTQLAHVQYMYEFRHKLVHEIGQDTAGHWNIRSSWDGDIAKMTGRIVLSMIAGIEAALTRYAPNFFPNLLTEDGYPITSSERYRNEAERLEALVNDRKAILDVEAPGAVSAWETASLGFATYLKAELDFIEAARPTYMRYVDMTNALESRLYEFRLGFLNDLMTYLAIAERRVEDVPSP